VRRLRRFLQEAVSELRKVTWPTFEQTRNLTVLVFVVSLAVGLYVLFWDTMFRGGIGVLSQLFT
jgi:preprotein translocase SecE subunit